MGTIPQLSVLKGGCWRQGRYRSLAAEDGAVRLSQMFDSKASSYPSDTALIYPDTKGKTWRISYSELAVWTNRLARGISAACRQGNPNSDGDFIVAVAMAPSHKLVATLLAIWKTNAAYLPLDPNSPPQRTKHILDESKPLLVITDDDHDSCAYGKTKRVKFGELEKDTENMAEYPLRPDETLNATMDRTSLILYTSGSTGIPKGVRIVDTAIVNRLVWQWEEFPYTAEEETCVFKTALTFVDSVSEIWGPLLCPGESRSILILNSTFTKDPQRLVSILHSYKIRRLVLVPTLLRSIIMYMNMSKHKNESLLKDLVLWICSGEALTESLARQFLDAFPSSRLCNFYGSTEVMGDVTYHVIDSKDDVSVMDKVPIGIPVDNTVIYLLDASMRPVPLGKVGELYVAGRNLAAGYVNKRDANRFIENPHATDPELKTLYRTGDYAKMIKGVILYEGRTDSQVKVRGHRVDLSEVEASLSKLAGVRKAVALCYQPGEIDQAILGFILPEDNTILYDKDLQVTLENFLPSYAIPQVIVIDTLPLLVNGKVDRQALLKQYKQLRYKEESEEAVLDLTDVSLEDRPKAEILLRTVASVVGCRGQISTSSDFYSLGGNSLNLVYTVTLLREKGLDISISDFISSKDLGEVLDRIKSHSGNHVASHLLSQPPFNLTYEMLDQRHKEDAYRIITDSFYYKADLERFIVPKIQFEDYHELMDALWQPLIEKNLSYAVLSQQGQVIGISLNFDAYDEPEINISSGLNIVFNFLEYLEAPIREKKLPKGKGEILHSFMMGTERLLSGGQNVELMEYMEVTNLELAKRRKFTGVFTSNTSPLTQQLGRDVFNYQVLFDYQVNRYVASDGTRPFGEAQDDQRVQCCWKVL